MHTDTAWVVRVVRLTPMVEKKRDFWPVRAVMPTKRSQERCIRPSAPRLLMVSSELTVSIRIACFCAASRWVWRTARASGHWISRLETMAMITARVGTQNSGPAIR